MIKTRERDEQKTTPDIKEVTKKLGKHHAEKATSTSALEKDRKEFFKLATEEIAKVTLRTKVVDVPAGMDHDEYVKRYHPGWVLKSVAIGVRQLLLEEDPAFVTYTYINTEDQKVYIRNAITSDYLDDERLVEERPEIWMKVSRPVPAPDLLIKFAKWCGGMEEELNAFIGDSDWPRELIPFEEMNPDDLGIVSEYLVPGPIQLRLETRKVKPEELDEDDD